MESQLPGIMPVFPVGNITVQQAVCLRDAICLRDAMLLGWFSYTSRELGRLTLDLLTKYD